MGNPGTRVRLVRAAWLGLPALVVLLSVYARLRLLGLPLERDEGELAYIGQLLLNGTPPFVTAYSLKVPGIFGAYALVMAVFGQTPEGIRLGLLAVNLAACALILLLGRRLYDLRTGAVCAAVYALLSVSQSVYGVVAHATHFLVLFALAGWVCLFAALDRKSRSLAWVSGVLFGLSFTMKQHAAPIALFALGFLAWRSLRDGASRSRVVTSSLLFCAGVGLPYLGCVVYLWMRGALPAFWFWTVQYAAQYATNSTLEEARHLLALQGAALVRTTALLWVVAAVQVVAVLRRKDKGGDPAFLIGFLLSGCAAVLPGYYFRPHYFVMMLPAVALLVGAAVTRPFRDALGATPSRRNALAAMVVAAGCVSTVYLERDYLFRLSPPQVSRAIYQANPFPESPAVAQYLRAHTTPDDRIAVLGSEPQIFFHADRLSATGYLCMYGLMEEQTFAGRMQEELISEVSAARPKYVVFVNVQGSWLARPRSNTRIFDWAADYLARHYELDGVVDLIDPQTTNLYWGAEAQDHPPRALNHLLVYKRRG